VNLQIRGKFSAGFAPPRCDTFLSFQAFKGVTDFAPSFSKRLLSATRHFEQEQSIPFKASNLLDENIDRFCNTCAATVLLQCLRRTVPVSPRHCKSQCPLIHPTSPSTLRRRCSTAFYMLRRKDDCCLCQSGITWAQRAVCVRPSARSGGMQIANVVNM
jgi:hypothetical protein